MIARLSALVATTFLATASVADPLKIETYRGPADVSENPQRIAVFDVAAADTINALGVPIAGTVDGLYVDYLDDVARDATPLGTFWEPDFEGVHALEPDLIIVGSRSSDQLDNMARIAPSIDMTIDQDLVGDAVKRLRDYGRIFGKTDAAAALEKKLDDRMSQAAQAAAGKGDVLIVMTNGPKISAYGAGGRFGWLHKDLGLPEAARKSVPPRMARRFRSSSSATPTRIGWWSWTGWQPSGSRAKRRRQPWTMPWCNKAKHGNRVRSSI